MKHIIKNDERKIKRDINKVLSDDIKKYLSEILTNSDDSYQRLIDAGRMKHDSIRKINVILHRSKREIDIFIPSKKLAIEYNGLYWHSENFIENTYHLDKTEDCLKQDIKLIHIFEDEWIYKKDIVKSRLLNLIGFSENKIYARNCEIKEVNSREALKFLDENHIQ
jgi:hypothetical protein